MNRHEKVSIYRMIQWFSLPVFGLFCYAFWELLKHIDFEDFQLLSDEMFAGISMLLVILLTLFLIFKLESGIRKSKRAIVEEASKNAEPDDTSNAL